MKQLADSSLLRLKNWDISEEQVKALAKSGEARADADFPLPSIRYRDREEGAARHAFHAG